MSFDVQFVDSVSLTAGVRLDLMAAPYRVHKSTTFGVPELKRTVVSTMLTDGDRYPAAAYGNRIITLVVQLLNVSDDAAAAAAQSLMRELDRPTNVLRYRPGTSSPVFFQTFRCGPMAVDWDPEMRQVTAQIPARSYALGPKESLGTVVVYNDPAEGTTLNANPYFETDASDWTGTGGTAARSTAQFHEGTASLLFTPDGVTVTTDARTGNAPAVAGLSYRASAWVRCAVARNVSININWRNAAGGLLSTSSSVVSLAATTWTLMDFTATAPAGTALAQMTVSIGSTPPPSNTLNIDEARLRQAGGSGGQCVDIAGIKGDVDTPLRLAVSTLGLLGSGRTSALAVRRRGNPAAAPFVLQAESMTMNIADTTVQPNSTAMSGPGSNFIRSTFATSASHTARAVVSTFPASSSPDVRGTYRAYARVRKSVAGDVMTMQLAWGTSGGPESVYGDMVAPGAIPDPQLVDMGLVSFPSGPDPLVDGYSGTPLPVRGQYMTLYAGRTSGTGNLDIDYILFVPADDRLAVIQWAQLGGAGADFAVVDGISRSIYGLSAAGEVFGGPAPSGMTGGFPMVTPGTTNRVYFLRTLGSQGATIDSVTDSTAITVDYWPRYLSVRPVAS